MQLSSVWFTRPGMLNDYWFFDYRIFLSFLFSFFKNWLSLLKLHQVITTSLQDAMPSHFNTTPIVMGGTMDDDAYTMQFMLQVCLKW